MTDIENEEKTRLNESALGECGEPMGMGMPAEPVDQGNPVTMSVTLNASGKEHVDDLVAMMKAAGLDSAGPAGPDMMPMRQDMDRLRSITADPEMSADGAYADGIGDDDGPTIKLGGIETDDDEPEEEGYENEPEPEEMRGSDIGGGINRPKKAYAASQDGDNAMTVEDELDEISSQMAKNYKASAKLDREYNDDDIASNSKKGDWKANQQLRRKNSNRQKGMYRADNRISKEDEFREGIKKTLLKALSEKKDAPWEKEGKWSKGQKKKEKEFEKKKPVKEASKPDFLDVDKDGDKKEPFKKAVKDKAKKSTTETSDAERNPSIEKSKYTKSYSAPRGSSAGDRAAAAYLKKHPGDHMGAAKAKKEANM